ncbi:MAG: LacI family DNA-binding transcriptional regulator [Candidatus Dormibacteraeota bacterium]|nr:LacI family DNA-binding transcriptional regulator [Candidatus Dormibacteraeota bacterium]
MRALPRNGRKRPATLEEVALLAGVSRATASRVFTDNPRVSPDARRSVERAAQKLGYVPNRAARSLVTGRSDSIGVVIPEPTSRLFGEPFWPSLVRGISDELRERDLQLVLFAPQSPADSARLEHYVTSGHVDGALLVSLHGSDPLPVRLAERGVPVVVGGRPLGGQEVSYVDVDNVAGAVAAVDHLLQTGRHRVATITGPQDMSAGIDRLEGYRSALAAAGVPLDEELIEEGDFGQESGRRAMAALLQRRPDLDAVFCADDLMAAGALRELKDSGRRVPEDVALVGYDDSAIATSTEPPLSSVRQPIEELGREMTRLLLAGIAAKARVPRRVILAAELVVRRSSEGATGEGVRMTR